MDIKAEFDKRWESLNPATKLVLSWESSLMQDVVKTLCFSFYIDGGSDTLKGIEIERVRRLTGEAEECLKGILPLGG